MSQFDQALSLVLDTLTQRQARVSKHDLAPSASLDSLRKLVESAPKGRLSVSLPTPGAPVAKAASSPQPADAPSRPAGSLTSRFSELRATLGDPKPTSPQPPAPAPVVREPAPAVQPPPTPAIRQGGSKAEQMAQLRERFAAEISPEIAFGIGNPDAELIFIGDAPQADEALPGDPFVGKAGQLLTKIIEAMGFRRENVYITNVLKTRPGASTAEAQLPVLIEEIGIIQPKCVVSLGALPIAELTHNTAPIDDLRGRWHSFKGIPLMATFHPEHLLQNQSITEKRKLWEDLLQVLELLGRPITPKQRGFFLSKG